MVQEQNEALEQMRIEQERFEKKILDAVATTTEMVEEQQRCMREKIEKFQSLHRLLPEKVALSGFLAEDEDEKKCKNNNGASAGSVSVAGGA